MSNPFDNEPVVTANLDEADARALLVLVEVGTTEITRKLDAGEYPHKCQQEMARSVVKRGAAMQRCILDVLARHERVLQ